MKIISDYKELEGKVFNTPEECQAEEAKIDAEKAKAAEASKPYEDAVAEAKNNLSRARAALKDAEGDARAIVAKAEAEIKAKLCPARQNVRDAEVAVLKAIEEYNKNVGPYQVEINEIPRIAPIDRIILDMIKRFG